MTIFNLRLKHHDGQYFIAVATVSKMMSWRQFLKMLPWRLFQKTLLWHQIQKFGRGMKLQLLVPCLVHLLLVGVPPCAFAIVTYNLQAITTIFTLTWQSRGPSHHVVTPILLYITTYNHLIHKLIIMTKAIPHHMQTLQNQVRRPLIGLANFNYEVNQFYQLRLATYANTTRRCS